MKKEMFIKIIFVFSLILSGQLSLIGQKTVDRKITKILQSDTIWFEIKTKSCWGGGSDLFKIFKQSGDIYSVRQIFTFDYNSTKTIDKNQLIKFGELFSSTIKLNVKSGCTLSHKFILSSKKQKVSFKESYCGEDFQPNKFLRQALNIPD